MRRACRPPEAPPAGDRRACSRCSATSGQPPGRRAITQRDAYVHNAPALFSATCVVSGVLRARHHNWGRETREDEMKVDRTQQQAPSYERAAAPVARRQGSPAPGLVAEVYEEFPFGIMVVDPG